MIRPVLTELALFPRRSSSTRSFCGRPRGVLRPEILAAPTLAWLTIAALVLMIGSFIVLAQFRGAARLDYVPAHMEKDGKLVPGTTK